MMVTLEWLIPMGHIEKIVALAFPEGNHLGLVTFSGEGGSVTVQVQMDAPAAHHYLAVPYFFMLDQEGKHTQTVCVCHVR